MDRQSPSGRIASLDVFRGLTIAGMVLVNNPGSWKDIYAPLEHAGWHGWTPTDLVFPFFLFLVGASIPFSLSKYRVSGDRRRLARRILRRTAILFAIGVGLNALGAWASGRAHVRIPGVLQRIAVCYLFASLLAVSFSPRALVAWTAALLAAYAAILLVPAPTAARVDRTVKPPSVEEVPIDAVGAADRPSFSREASLPSWVDRQVLGDRAYAPDYDPEGILSTIPAVATTLLGVLAGLWFAQRRPVPEAAAWLFTAGSLLAVLGYVASAAVPINKALWTTPYVLLTGGLALLFLGFCHFTVDGLGARRWSRPFEVLGSNALLVFVLSTLLARLLAWPRAAGTPKAWLYRTAFESWLTGPRASLAYALANVLLWLGVAWVLYRRRVFVRL